MSTSGGYHEYVKGCSVHWGDIMSTSGDVQYMWGNHDACGGASWQKPFNFYWKPQCTKHPLMY